MTAVLVYPPAGGGRKAFPNDGKGGTLNAKGVLPGRFYRSKGSTAPATVLSPGLTGFRADRDSTACDINDYAVYRAVMFLQRRFGAKVVDGILGPQTDASLKVWQGTKGLVADGVYGPATARVLLTPLVAQAAKEIDPAHHGDLAKIVRGTIAYESGWDHGAVGGQDPRDLGIAQIHLPMHPDMTPNMAFDPDVAVPWMVRFVDGNLEAMKYNVRDAVAAYNLGRGGARTWISAGRPQWWTPAGSTVARDMWKYIDSILAEP